MQDMTVPCGDGLINIRAGALIVREGKLLMTGNSRDDYLYSVGGRVKMGETAEEAIVREVFEETGARLKVRRLAFVHENYFYGDAPSNMGKLIYELSFYFRMEVPPDFEPVCGSVAGNGVKEELRWVSPDTEQTIYPEFFRTQALVPETDGVLYFRTDERRR